jgi:hypothetical protein
MTAMTVPYRAPADRRHVRVREILAQQGSQGATIAQLHRWLSAEGLNVPRETLHRWLAGDETAGLVHRGPGRTEAGVIWYWPALQEKP